MSGIHLDIQLSHQLHGANGPIELAVAFALPAGEALALTGPSGAGKTSLLRQIAGLMTPMQGRVLANENVWFDSEHKQHLPVQQRHVGYVFQDYALFPHFSVLENLMFAARKPEDSNRIEELLGMTGLSNLAERKPHQLSGGQQQRVALARALVSNPPLLLLDEPMAALDPDMRVGIRDFIGTLRQRYGFTMMIITHDHADIFELADKVAIMKDGKIEQLGTPWEIYMQNVPDHSAFNIHAEVVALQELNGTFSAAVKIQNRIQSVTITGHLYSTLKPGMHIALQIGHDPENIRILSGS